MYLFGSRIVKILRDFTWYNFLFSTLDNSLINSKNKHAANYVIILLRALI